MDAGEIYNYCNLCHSFCFFSHFSHLDQSGSGWTTFHNALVPNGVYKVIAVVCGMYADSAPMAVDKPHQPANSKRLFGNKNKKAVSHALIRALPDAKIPIAS